MTTMRTATAQDFIIGSVLTCKTEGHEFTITSEYANGIWVASTSSGIKCVFESEASCYDVKNTLTVQTQIDKMYEYASCLNYTKTELIDLINLAQADGDLILMSACYKLWAEMNQAETEAAG